MRVELTIGVFATDEHAEDVLALLRHFARGRHDWAVSPGDIEVIAAYLDRHAKHLAKGYTELARKAAVNHVAWAVANTQPPARVVPDDLRDHVADLERPAVVAVENNDSDGCFIKAIARVFGGMDLLHAIEEGWLVVDHGGGQPDACRRAQEEHAKFRCLGRVAALFDSDRMVPGAVQEIHHRADQLREIGVLVHVLELREVENYIPNRVLRSVTPHRETSRRLDALKQLSHAQRGHFDMKYGFGKTGGIPDSQASLFTGVPEQVIIRLMQGFGKNVIKDFAK